MVLAILQQRMKIKFHRYYLERYLCRGFEEYYSFLIDYLVDQIHDSESFHKDFTSCILYSLICLIIITLADASHSLEEETCAYPI